MSTNPTYNMLQFVGILMQGGRKKKDFLTVTGLNAAAFYGVMKTLFEHQMVASRLVGDEYEYTLTEKGRRYGRRYNLGALARNPPMVSLDEFEAKEPGR